MRRGVALRAALFLLAAVASLVYLAPSFVPALPSWWGAVLPTDRIHLGLDLQG